MIGEDGRDLLINQILYADDAALVDKDAETASDRLTTFN